MDDLKLNPLRVLRLQSALKSLGIDAALLVNGVDGGWNVGSSQAIAWLFSLPSLPALLEDSIILVGHQRVSAFLPNGQPTLAGGLAGVQLFVPTEEETSDPDLAEEAKLVRGVWWIVPSPCSVQAGTA